MSEQLVQLPGSLPIFLTQGDDLSIDLVFSEEVASFTYESEILSSKGLLIFSIPVSSTSDTELSLTIPALVTQSLSQNSRWHLTFIDANAKRRTMLAGPITVTMK